MAPATANTIGKFANGLADDFLSSLYLATARAGAARAGDEHATCSSIRRSRRNLETLMARGVQIVDPGSGYLACGWIGKGRLAEPDEVVAAAEQAAARRRRPHPGGHAACWSRQARPTKTSIRCASSATARAAAWAMRWRPRRCGAAPTVTLVTGPTHLSRPHGAEVVTVRSAAEMHARRDGARARDQDVVIMAAAVADYTPAEPAAQKVKKADGAAHD